MIGAAGTIASLMGRSLEKRMALAKADSGNAAIEFHDSEVGAIERDGTMLTVRFSPAYIHRAEGIPGVDSGTGWTQEAVMVLFGSHLSGEAPTLPCTLSDGSVAAGREFYDNLIPVPFVYVGKTRVILSFDDGSEVQIKANEFRLITVGEAVYVESCPA